MNSHPFAYFAAATIAIGAAFPATAASSVVLDQIGDVNAYNLGLMPGPTPSQIFPDFPDYNCTALDDFTLTGTELRITQVSVLFRAQGGFISFQDIQGYYLNFFSDPGLAATSLTGDVASVVVTPASGASVTRITDGSGTYEYGLVRLNVEVPMPSAGNYWVGISPAAPVSSGQFFVMHGGAFATATPGNANGRLANPADGFGAGTLTATNLDYAYTVIIVPEPNVSALWLIGIFGGLWQHRRTRPGAPAP